MAIVVVQHVPQLNTSAVNHTVTLGSAPTAANLTVVVFKPMTVLSQITPPSGWTLAVNKDRGASLLSTNIYYRVAQGGDPAAVTWTTSGATNSQMEGFEVSGLATTSPLDKTASVDSGITAVATLPVPTTGTLAQASEWAVSAVGLNTTSAGEAVDSGFGLRDDPTLTSLIVADLTTAATAALAPTFSWTTTRTCTGVTATFLAASAPTSQGRMLEVF